MPYPGYVYTALAPGAVGVKPADLSAAIQLASRHGFQGLEVNAREIARLVVQDGAAAVKQRFAAAGLRPAGFGLPVDWRGAEDVWAKGIDELPHMVAACASIGATRCMTWVMPGSDERPFEENYRFHVSRFRPAAQILANFGCRLGLEFIGPKTLRSARAHEFIYTMGDMLKLGAEIGPNVGLLLDCWHWYTSGGTVAELQRLQPEQVVYVHVSDAPTGVPVDQQIDNVRMLPGETGLIDIKGFLTALQHIGYDGPVVVEPFKKDLNDLPSDDARLERVRASLDSIFQRAGVIPAA